MTAGEMSCSTIVTSQAEKKIQATPTKQGLGSLVRVLSKIPDEHLRPFCMDVIPTPPRIESHVHKYRQLLSY